MSCIGITRPPTPDVVEFPRDEASETSAACRATTKPKQQRRITMPTTLPLRSNQTLISRLRRGALAAYLLSLAAICNVIAVNGPQMRAAAEAQEAQIIEAENTAFCSKFGIGPQTSRYAECAKGLAELRARYLQRNVGDSIL